MLTSSFRTRLIILVTTLVLAVQLVSFFSVLTAIEANVERDARKRLALGAQNFERLMDSKHRELSRAVSVLTADFGFKAAVATRDSATIESALQNHGERVSADAVALLSLKGEVIARTIDVAETTLSGLARRAAGVDDVMITAIFDGQPYLAVLVPVKAPRPIALAMMAFAIDDEMMHGLSSSTGLDMSVITTSVGDSLIISTLNRESDSHESKDAPLLFDPKRYYSHSLAIESIGGDVRILLHRSIAQAMLPFLDLRTTLIIIASIAALLSLIVAIALANGVTRPIRILVEAATRIRNGDYSQPLPDTRRDELGMLALTLNNMQTGIAQREAQIVHQATHDELTALPVRRVALDWIDTVITRYQHREAPCFAVICIGIVGFQRIKESLGFDIGDEVMKQLAHRLMQLEQTRNSTARIGESSFLLLLDNSDETAARAIAQTLVTSLGESILVNQAELNLDIATGIALYPDSGSDSDTLIRRADIARSDASMNSARINVFQVGRDENHLRQLAIAGALTNAVNNNELQMHYQPKVRLCNPGHLQVEALMRWTHSNMGRMSPDEFIPLAEQSGHITEFTNWMLLNVVQQCADWEKTGLSVSVSVNLSAFDLLDEQLPQRLTALLSEHDLPPSRLVLEITESAALQDADITMRVLHSLRDAGYSLSIDDFGTGYSSLAKLKELPVDELKIDKSFVLRLNTDEHDRTIVRSTIELGHKFGLLVTAEGVEDEESLLLLRELGCDTVQGYHIARPMAADDLLPWLRSQSRRTAPEMAQSSEPTALRFAAS